MLTEKWHLKNHIDNKKKMQSQLLLSVKNVCRLKVKSDFLKVVTLSLVQKQVSISH